MQVTKPVSKRKHHTSICPGKYQESADQMNKPPSKQSPNNQAPNNQSPGIPTVHATVTMPDSGTPINVIVMNTACLLKTAIVPVQAPNFTTQANIQFDERAQRSYFTRKLAIDY